MMRLFACADPTTKAPAKPVQAAREKGSSEAPTAAVAQLLHEPIR
jgi:hypothetical protein